MLLLEEASTPPGPDPMLVPKSTAPLQLPARHLHRSLSEVTLSNWILLVLVRTSVVTAN